LPSTNYSLEQKKDWTFKEWITNFLAEGFYDQIEDDEIANGEGFHDRFEPMPGGDADYYDELDESILESILIIGCALAMGMLWYYRQLRQRNAQERANLIAQEANGQLALQGDNQPNQEAIPDGNGERGFFPNQNEPEFQQWIAGGIGH
jgi:SEL1 protein